MINSKKEDLKKLIVQAQNDDFKSMEKLIKRIQKDIYSTFCFLTTEKQDISDLTQEALLKIAKNLKQLKKIDYFKNWKNRIVTNVFNDYLRRKKENENCDEKLLEIKDKYEPSEKCIFSELDNLIKKALLNLPTDLRVVIILREYEGLSYEDISKITNTALGTVKSRISRARIKLQEQLKDYI